jgi:hypothetical protein
MSDSKPRSWRLWLALGGLNGLVGDTRRGQWLMTWTIREGRRCVRTVDDFLMGATDLPQ